MSSVTSARRTSIPTQTTGDTQYNVPNAALRGASLAFSKPAVKPKPRNNYTGGSNGAFLAANIADAEHSRSAPSSGRASPVKTNWTGDGRTNGFARSGLSSIGSPHSLHPPNTSVVERTPSPSNIAARLAAARYTAANPGGQRSAGRAMEDSMQGLDSMPPRGIVGGVLTRFDSKMDESAQPPDRGRGALGPAASRSPHVKASPGGHIDRESIPPTTDLVKLFGGNTRSSSKEAMNSLTSPPQNGPIAQQHPANRIDSKSSKGKSLPNINSSSPSAVVQETVSMRDADSQAVRTSAEKQSAKRPPITPKPSELSGLKSATSRTVPAMAQMDSVADKSMDLTLVTPTSRRLSSALSTRDLPSPSSFVSAKEEQEEDAMSNFREQRTKPTLPPPRKSSRAKHGLDDTAPRKILPKPSTTAQASAASTIGPAPVARQVLQPPEPRSISRASSPGAAIFHSDYQRESVKAITKHLTGESISSAIVGAAVAASSRNASPARSVNATPQLPARRQHHLHLNAFGRSPSPPKAQLPGKMRTTMRKEPTSSEDESDGERYRKKGTRIMGLGRKHPNKHHEGTRKRWRDQVTDRERKRYGGVWAANKGLFTEQRLLPQVPAFEQDTDQDVHALAVRELWQRSRLPDYVLEEVWDLVDSRGVGRLRREEFVVGLWLVDQRLKGRKLPSRVTESVWSSVRGAGVKIKVKPRR